MSELTVERRPGRLVFVAGLLGHRAVVEDIARLLVDPDALDLAQKVARAAESCRDSPDDEVADDAYVAAMNDLAAYLESTAFVFHDWDLEPVAEAVQRRIGVAV